MTRIQSIKTKSESNCEIFMRCKFGVAVSRSDTAHLMSTDQKHPVFSSQGRITASRQIHYTDRKFNP